MLVVQAAVGVVSIVATLLDERDAGVELADYQRARERLEVAGYRLRPEADGWEAFRRRRAQYAGRVNALAIYWASPPAQWIGERPRLKDSGHGDRPPPGARRVRIRRPRPTGAEPGGSGP